jgi:diguanylate cyclase (GGDEF)-like protein
VLVSCRRPFFQPGSRASRVTCGLAATLGLCLGPAAASDSHSGGQPLRTLVTARSVHELTPEEAARAYPVHLRGVATYFDPDLNDLPDLFVHDSTGSIFVEFSSPPHLRLRAGDLVDVVGVSGPGDFAPVVDKPQVRFIGQSHLPEAAQKTTLAELLSGTLDGQWVEMEGVVHAVHATRSNVTLDLATLGGSIRLTMPRETGADYDSLIDAAIRLRGNAGPVLSWKSQMVGAQLFSPSLKEITVVEPAPRDPFGMPALPLSHFMRFNPSMKVPHRVRVQGQVTLQWPGRSICIQQRGEGLCMDTAQTDRVNTGILVDAIGFPAVNAYKPTLENATFRAAGSDTAAPSARPVTAEQAASGECDGELVQIEGQLVSRDHVRDDLQLMLRAAGTLIPALLPSDSVGSSSFAWKEGSMLRLTGICNGQPGTETWNLRNGQVRPGSVQILLRSAGDVLVLQSPSWWTAEHALAILAIAGVVSFAAIAWIVVLRRRVAQQTHALRTSEERLRHLSEHDILTGLPNRLLLNDRLTAALEHASRFEERLGVLMVDLDHFKEANDVYGHQAGDKLLCQVAKRLSESVRLTDTVARLGGDEFVVLLPSLRERYQAEAIAAKVVSAVSVPVDIGPARITVTVSVGVCTYPEGGADPESLMRNVDSALYAAKAHGRNVFEVYAPAQA